MFTLHKEKNLAKMKTLGQLIGFVFVFDFIVEREGDLHSGCNFKQRLLSLLDTDLSTKSLFKIKSLDAGHIISY